MKRILIDIGHPAHVHIFKNFARQAQHKGWQLLFTCRDKEHEITLLNEYGFNFISFGKNYRSKFGKIVGLFRFNLKLLRVSLRFRPMLLLSHGSMYAAHVAFLLRKPHISLEDSGNMEQIRLYAPFTKTILSPDFLPNKLGKKHLRYQANHELFYLHPNYYKPDSGIYNSLGLKNKEPYAILRFVSWLATHDSGQRGMSNAEKKRLVETLEQKGVKVFISAERHQLPDELKKNAISIHPAKMHDALAFATFYIGEGATMASEAGVLGTPSLYVSTIERCYNVDQEKYGLVFNFNSFEGVIEKIDEILAIENGKQVFQKRRQIFLKEKIDPTAFFFWFIENYPQSISVVKQNPHYQNQFHSYDNIT